MVEWQPTVIIGWLAVLGAYLYVIGPLARRYHKPVNRGQAAAFLFGMAILFLALQSPLDYLSDHYLFSAHMLQHMLMIFAVAPLLLAGTPGWFLRPLLRQRVTWPLARVLTRPLMSLLLFNGVFTLYHFPILYNASLASEPLHAVMHLVFLGTALLSWWPILSPLADLPRLSHPMQLLYLGAQSVLCQPVGAIITLTPEPVYQPYATAPRIIGLSALEDQQLGGLLMWVGGVLLYFCFLTVVFFRWALQSEAREGPPAAPDAGTRSSYGTLRET